MQEQRAELEWINGQLKEKILGRASESGSHPTAISGFHLVRRVQANELCVFYRPFIGLTVQGFKRTIVGKDEYSYGEYHCFVAGVDMPSESYITVASDEEPFLALSLDLDRSLVAQLAAEYHIQPVQNREWERVSPSWKPTPKSWPLFFG